MPSIVSNYLYQTVTSYEIKYVLQSVYICCCVTTKATDPDDNIN